MQIINGYLIRQMKLLLTTLIIWPRGLNSSIRYVGVVRFVFMFSNFSRVDILKQNVCYISRSIRKHQQKSDGKVDLSLDLVAVIIKCTLVDLLTEHRGLPNHVHYQV